MWKAYVNSEEVSLFTPLSEEKEYNFIFTSLFILILFQILEFCLLFPLHFSMNLKNSSTTVKFLFLIGPESLLAPSE
jgi:hypothetical protein